MNALGIDALSILLIRSSYSESKHMRSRIDQFANADLDVFEIINLHGFRLSAVFTHATALLIPVMEVLPFPSS
jgi:hypothetical protein